MIASSRRPLFFTWSLWAAVVVIALLPWWRNHHYLRDLYDYGLVIAANGHLDRGERPYVDFTTPIQAGFLGLNWLIEKAGGGTYAALTLGGAGLIVISALLLPLMLARRWPWWAALAVGWAVTAMSAAQHTILWHNSLGVFCLAVAGWAAACAPVLRRATWPWHALAAAGLLLGGINKLNFQLIALAVSVAWAVRAGLVRSSGWGRVGATIAFLLLAAVALPVAAEMAWTGASLKLWLANVVGLAAGSRLDLVRQVLSVDFLFRPMHDYYEPLLLPQVGLAGVLLSLAALGGCWPARPAAGAARWDWVLVPVAVILAAAAGAALLATNFEIACLGSGAWLVLVTSLWLGFAPASRPAAWRLGGLVLPALVLGAAGWWAAWQGQRSQFGYSKAPREAYRPVESAGPVFARMKGLWLPPGMMASLDPMAQSLPEVKADGRRPVFYGQGLEWLDRYLPGAHFRGQPLWFHWGTTYGPAEITQLAGKLLKEDDYGCVVTTIARQLWPDEIDRALNKYFFPDFIGPEVRRWTRREKDAPNLADSLDTVARLGGNFDGRAFLRDKLPLNFRATADGRILFGTTQKAGEVLLQVPSYQLRGVAVVDRLPGTGDRPLSADFKLIVHGASPENIRWSARLELPAGQQTVSLPFTAEAQGKPLMMWITRPDGQEGGLLAGFRELEITHAVEATGAPRLRDRILPEVAVTSALTESLFQSITWRPRQLVVRGGQSVPAGLELSVGGEVWLHTDTMSGEIRGRLQVPATASQIPFVRVLWYKGGRLQVLQQFWPQPGQPVDFRAWTAEPGGWFGLLTEGGERAAPVLVQVTGSTLTP